MDNNDNKATDTDLLVKMLANTERITTTEHRIDYDNKTEKPTEQFNDDAFNNVNNYSEKHSDKYSDKHSDKQYESEYHSKQLETHDPGYNMRQLDMLRKLGELQECGITISQDYGVDSDYNIMKAEYDLRINMRNKRNAVNLMSSMMLMIVKGVELLNDKYNPFDCKFDGSFTYETQRNITSYYDILGEIYEKYSSPDKSMAPELKLFFNLIMTAIGTQLAKSIASGINSVDDDDAKLKQLKEKEQNIKDYYKKQDGETRKHLDQLREAEINTRHYDNLKTKSENKSEMHAFRNSLLLTNNMDQKSFDKKSISSKSHSSHSSHKHDEQHSKNSKSSSKLENKSTISKGKNGLELHLS